MLHDRPALQPHLKQERLTTEGSRCGRQWVLFSEVGPSGPATVSVSYGGSGYPFTSMAQLATDGYSGTAALSTGTGGLPLVFPYSGS